MEEWEELAGTCAWSDDPEIVDAYEEFMEGCLSREGF
jgi:hypothetical protein